MNRCLSMLFFVWSMTLSCVAWSGAESGLYLGGSLGSADHTYDDTTDFEGLEDNASSIKVFGGFNFGWLPMLDLAVEASYVDFGEVEEEIPTAMLVEEIRGVDAFGLVGLKLGIVGLYVKTGYIRWERESTEFGRANESSGTDPVAGVGLRLQFASLALRLEYEEFDIEEADIALYSAGVSWTF